VRLVSWVETRGWNSFGDAYTEGCGVAWTVVVYFGGAIGELIFAHKEERVDGG